METQRGQLPDSSHFLNLRDALKRDWVEGIQLAWNQDEDGTFLCVIIVDDNSAIETIAIEDGTEGGMLVYWQPTIEYWASRQGPPQRLAIVLDGGVSGVTLNPAPAPNRPGDAERRAVVDSFDRLDYYGSREWLDDHEAK